MSIKYARLIGNTRVLFAALILVVVSLALVNISGCTSVPVQEMSDARQAIRAAQNEGVSSQTSSEFADALRLIKLAQQKLEKREYKQARYNALEAKQKALEARNKAIESNAR